MEYEYLSKATAITVIHQREKEKKNVTNSYRALFNDDILHVEICKPSDAMTLYVATKVFGKCSLLQKVVYGSREKTVIVSL